MFSIKGDTLQYYMHRIWYRISAQSYDDYFCYFSFDVKNEFNSFGTSFYCTDNKIYTLNRSNSKISLGNFVVDLPEGVEYMK